MKVIETKSLSKIFHNKFSKNALALNNLSISVSEGSIYGFIGPNGAGKSTTLKLLMGFIFPSSGSATLVGININNPTCRSKVGFLPENPRYYEYLTGKELLFMSGKLRGMSGKNAQIEAKQLLEQVDLAESANRQLSTYSKGMTQRLGLANALMGDPNLLILDEPMSGLDPMGRDLVRRLMLDLRKKGKTIFFSSHILHDVESICDEVAVIIKGKLRQQGRITDMLSQPTGEHFTLLFRPPKENHYDPSTIILNPTERVEKFEDNTISLTISGEEQLKKQVQHLMNQGASLLKLEPKRYSLEEYFLEILPDNESAKTIPL